MKTRIITAIILLLIVVPPLYFGGIPFTILAFVANVLGTKEMLNLVNKEWSPVLTYSVHLLSLLMMYSNYLGLNYFILMEVATIIYLGFWLVKDEKVTFEQIGMIFMYLNIFSMMMAGIVTMYGYGNLFVFYMVIGTTFPDMFAYFVGRAIGKHKLNERISPNKTIEGSIGGFVCGTIADVIYGILVLQRFYDIPLSFIIISALAMSFVGQIGDLFYSAIKRHYGIKDFSNLFPGHGGVLDRLDSISFNSMLLFALIVVLL
ncbi:MAG: phosphatidate cytidylyltransferase [Erysipelotrichaceae bacterium]|nr:phosphatidate cytidylyltransferase [Erysipelotrichaceae bacterium]